mmetsp:Transcript_50758/g.135369  ORF Transcript_50758/g.135369 Transcript_50758/m.135369 type:complete len:307 (-) Transcript_50758:15-935(-)
MHVRLTNRVEHRLGKTFSLTMSLESRVEKYFWRQEAFGSHPHHATVGHGVLSIHHRCLLGKLPLGLEVVSHVTTLLLDLAHSFEIGRRIQRIPLFLQQLHQILRDMTSCQVDAGHQRRLQIARCHWDKMRHAIARVHHETGITSPGFQSQNSLHRNVHPVEPVLFKHGLDDSLSVFLWIQCCFCLHDGVIRRVDPKLRKSVIPDGFHVIPVFHHAVLNWMLQRQHGPRGVGLVTDHQVLQHDALVHAVNEPLARPQHWSSDKCRKRHRRRLLASKASLDHTRSSIAYHSGVVLHGCECDCPMTYLT